MVAGIRHDDQTSDVDVLRAQIEELRETLESIRRGGVDAVISGEPGAERIYTLSSADRPYRLIIEDMSEGAATVSDRGVVLYANRGLARMVGREDTNLAGSDAADLVVEADGDALARLLALHPGEHGRAEVRLNAPDRPLATAISASCLDLEGMPVHCLVATDLTEQKEAEHKLEERVRARTNELQVANARLTESNAELEAFSYSISHDLKAPLRAVHGFAQILVDEHADQLDAEGVRLLGVVIDSTVRMGELIEDILALAHLGRAELHPQRVDIEPIVRSVVEELRTRHPGREVAVDIVGPLPAVVGDESLLRQVWLNLIGNAFKFTSPVAHPQITIDSERQGALAVFRVADNGVGFDPHYEGKLFGVFQRLHGAEFPGTGIGLAIVKRIVDRHGGWVAGEGRLGAGATFSVALPCAGAGDGSSP